MFGFGVKIVGEKTIFSIKRVTKSYLLWMVSSSRGSSIGTRVLMSPLVLVVMSCRSCRTRLLPATLTERGLLFHGRRLLHPTVEAVHVDHAAVGTVAVGLLKQRK